MHEIVFTEVEEEDTALVKKLLSNDVRVFSKALSEDELIRQCSDAEVLSPFIYTKITKRVMEAMPKLKLITTRSTGYDHIDVAYAKQRGIAVANIPDYGANTVAEHAFALLLAVARHIPRAVNHVRGGEFSYRGFQGVDIMGKTFGVVGTGRIGLTAAKIAKGFGMNVVATDVIHNDAATKDIGFRYVDLLELLSKSDFISLHVPLLPSTRHLINSKNIHHIKRGAVLINTSRGPIIETEALRKALDDGTVGGAGLDVVEGEDAFSKSHPLAGRDNVLITPHIAFFTREAQQRIIQKTVENIDAFYKGTLKGVV